jgi:hypothetical protein
LQYYELYTALPEALKPRLDEMPRQATYSLASRNAPIEQKQEIIANYQGQPKQELLELIRISFPLADKDQRAHDPAEMSIASLRRIRRDLSSTSFQASDAQKQMILHLLDDMKALLLHE